VRIEGGESGYTLDAQKERRRARTFGGSECVLTRQTRPRMPDLQALTPRSGMAS
jgi:hypothetical protein